MNDVWATYVTITRESNAEIERKERERERHWVIRRAFAHTFSGSFSMFLFPSVWFPTVGTLPRRQFIYRLTDLYWFASQAIFVGNGSITHPLCLSLSLACDVCANEFSRVSFGAPRKSISRFYPLSAMVHAVVFLATLWRSHWNHFITLTQFRLLLRSLQLALDRIIATMQYYIYAVRFELRFFVLNQIS